MGGREGYSVVMPGLVPGIHVLGAAERSWMAGTSPAMTPVAKPNAQDAGVSAAAKLSRYGLG
jgi:hypothetical protein